MDRITEKTIGILSSAPSHDRSSVYIKELKNCAHTCRMCAEICAKGGKKFSEVIDICLENAKTCEALARDLLLQKDGKKDVRQVKIEACVVTNRLCGRICTEKADIIECIAVCANASRHCADVISMLLPKSSRNGGKGLFAFLRTPIGK